MGGPWEDFAPQDQDGPWNDFAPKDAPNDGPQGISPMRALLTNDPTSGFTEDIIRGIPATIGGMVGGATGLVAGAPLTVGAVGTSMAGASLGGAAGEGLRQTASQLYAGATGREMSSPEQVLGGMASQGVVNGLGQGVGLGGGAAYRATRPAFSRGGAIAMKVAANVPEKSGVYALNDLTRLGKAPSDEAVGQAYDAFHSASGTIGRKEAVARSGDPFDTVSRAVNSMKDAYTKLRAGTLTVQEAVEASQAGRIIRDMKSRGNEFAQEVAGTADALKGSFDDFIERGMGATRTSKTVPVTKPIPPGVSRVGHHAPRIKPEPLLDAYGQPLMMETVIENPARQGFSEWQAARQAAFENSVAADFGSALPRNVNGSPNVLRTWSAIGGGATSGAATGAMIGGPAGAALGGMIGAVGGGLSVSPMAYGAAIRAAGAASRVTGAVPGAVYRVGARATVGGSGSALADAYMRQQVAR